MTTDSAIISTSFLLGFAGSLHCVGMCGPLALSLPVQTKNTFSRIRSGLIYNSGRIVTYVALGILLGTLSNRLILIKWQGILSLSLGVLILLYLLVPKKFYPSFSGIGFTHFFLLLRHQLGKLFRSPQLHSLFFIGILNGLLPCGLVLLALSSSAILANTFHGGLFMLFFGLGTFPLMFATVLMGNYFNQWARRKINKAVPVLLFFMALLLILRGLNLGIPLISPGLTGSHNQEAVSCH